MVYIPVQRYSCICMCVLLQRRWKRSPRHALAEEFDAGRIGLVVEGRPEIQKVCCALDCNARGGPKSSSIRGRYACRPPHAPLDAAHHTYRAHCDPHAREILAGGSERVRHAHELRPRSRGRERCACRTSRPCGLPAPVPGPCWYLHAHAPGNCREAGREPAGSGENSCRTGGWRVVAGSGFDLPLMAEAQALGAEAFLSSEMKLSVARAAPLPCIESTHYALESPAMRRLAAQKGWQYIDDPPLLAVYP